MGILNTFMNNFNVSGYNDSDVIAICEWGGDIVAVKCDDEMSGYYPHYETAVPVIFKFISPFKINNKTENGESIDAIIIQVNHTNNIVEICFATDSHDGFQPL